MRSVGGPGALLSIWALTTVPAALGVYILRTMSTDRWGGTAAADAVLSLPGTLLIWLVLTVAFTAWGTAHTWQRQRAPTGATSRRRFK